jgi:ApbE superfamily uncharacterized protein (UPF0280 family)
MVDSARRQEGKARGFIDRTYRDFSNPARLHPFAVKCKETDLYLRAERDLSAQALAALIRLRKQIEDYIRKNPGFRTSLEPIPLDPKAPPVVQEMMRATRHVSVGPMAAVAGAIAEGVGRALRVLSREIVVENGGDVYLQLEEATTVGIFAGESPLTMRLGLRVPAQENPCGICTSSGTVGPSLSLGRADAVTVWAVSTALADAAATALANQILDEEDIEPTLRQAEGIPGLKGVVAILGDKIGLWGCMDLVKLKA